MLSEDSLRNTLGLAGIATVEWRADKARICTSYAWRKLTGWNDNKLPNFTKPISKPTLLEIIKDWMELVHPDDRKEARANMIDYFYLRKDTPYNNHYRLR